MVGDYQEINYKMLIMLHLDRLSRITTNAFNTTGEGEKENTSNELGLSWGVDFLKSIIPNDLKDDKFIKEIAEINKELPSHLLDFARLQTLINLLKRKGLLLQERRTGVLSPYDEDLNDDDGNTQ
jgi:hypothetical protein